MNLTALDISYKWNHIVFVFVFLHVMLLPKPPFVDFTEYRTHCHDTPQNATSDEENFFTPK